MRLLLACLVFWPLSTSANGNDAHVWITRQALQQLPDGSLKQLLSRPELENRLFNDQISALARRYMRDLKRTASIRREQDTGVVDASLVK